MAEKRYYWIKLKTDFFDLPTIDWLLSQKNGCEYIVLYQMLCLKTANNNGMMANGIGEMLIPYDVEKIVRDTKYFDFDTVTVALELFKKLGLVYKAENDVLHITGIEEMVGASSNDEHTRKLNAERQKRFRERHKKTDNTVTVTLKSNTEIDIEKDKEIDIEKDKDKEKKETFVSIVDSYTDNHELKASLNDFIEMRKKMKGFTTRALKLALNELDKIAIDDLTKIDVVNQSVMNSWKSFYPIHSKLTKQQKDELPF